MKNQLNFPLAVIGLSLVSNVNASTLEESLLSACGFDINPILSNLDSVEGSAMLAREILIDGEVVPPDFCNDIGAGDAQAFNLMLKAMTPNQLGSTTRSAQLVGKSQGRAIHNRLQNLRDLAKQPDSQELGGVSSSLLVGGAASAEALLGQGVAVFGTAQFNNGDKEKTNLEESYDWSGNSLSLGGDYRLNNNLIIGGAISLSNNDTAFGSARGQMDSSSVALSTYGTYYTDKAYVDWNAGYGYFDYKTRRDVVFMTIDTSASGETNGDQWSFNVSGGTDFFVGDKTISPYFGVSYVDTTVDGYTETGAGSYNYAVDKQDTISKVSVLGVRVSQAKSYCWGVLSPSAHIEWQYEFNRDPSAINSAFDVDPTLGFNSSTDLPDRSYFNAGASVSMMLPGGRAGFVSISRVFKQQYINNTILNIGYRAEF